MNQSDMVLELRRMLIKQSKEISELKQRLQRYERKERSEAPKRGLYKDIQVKQKQTTSPFEEEPFSFRNVKPSLYSTASEKRNSGCNKRSPQVTSGGPMARRKSDSSQLEYSPYVNALAHASRVQSILDHFTGLYLIP